MDGWTDGKKVEWKEWKVSFTTQALSLFLIETLISHTPALNGDARERITAEANSYHDFCNNESAVLMFI